MNNIEDLEAMEAEIKLMTMLTVLYIDYLQHQNIVRLLGVEHTQNNIYIISEYLGGGNLRQYLNRVEDIKEDEIKRIFFQICSAVEYCHSRSIAHRDLKPYILNIIVKI